MGSIFTCCRGNEEEPLKKPLIHPSSLDPLTPEAFEIIKVLGRGNFGKVFLVKKKGMDTLYAMKTLKKKIIEDRKQRAHTVTERKVLENSKCPFIARLYYAFQNASKLYMVMEYLNGGELFFHLSKEGSFSEIRAKFYIAEILIGLNYLHSQGIIYRDLKPENILLDCDGHIRLTDFGLSKDGLESESSKAYTFCGTPEYLAPEILRCQGHDKAVDYWSLGAVMYYMLSGAPPFYSKNKHEIFKNVLTKPIGRLQNITNEGNDLLQGLLKIDVKNI
jgi:serine/threonine protein kinase